MPTAADYALQLGKLFPNPATATPQQIRVLLDSLQDVTDTLDAKLTARLAIPDPSQAAFLAQIQNDLNGWKSLFNYYKITANKAVDDGPGTPEADGLTLFYKRVTGPLVDGQCYAPPSCTEAVLQQGVPFAVAPRATVPFQIETAMDGNDVATAERFRRFIEDVAETLKTLVKVTVDMASESIVKPLLYGAGAVVGAGFLLWMLRRR